MVKSICHSNTICEHWNWASNISYNNIARYKPYAASNFVVSLNESDITLSSATYSNGQLFYFYDLDEDVIK